MTYIANLQIKVDSTQVEAATDKLNELIQASKGLENSPLNKPVPPAKPTPPPKPPAQPKPATPKPAPDSNKLLEQIDRQTSSLNKLAKQQKLLNEARDAGVYSDDTAAKYNQIIDTQRQKIIERGNVVEQVSKKEAAAEQQRLNEWFKNADTQKTVQAEYLDSLAKGSQARQKQAAEDEATERKRLDSWFESAEKQKQAEAKDIADRHAALANASKVRQKQAEDDAAAEKSRLDNWLKDGDKRNKDFVKQEEATEKARVKYRNDAHQRLLALDKEKKNSTLSGIKADNDSAAAAVTNGKRRKSAAEEEAKAMDNLLAAIDPVTKERQRLAKLESQLQAAYAGGKITEEQRGKYQGVIDGLRAKTDRYKDSLGRTALTAKQLQMAQMGLPAQFTDIAVSLQGGQAPLTVFLQQGGQIKDMFGGVGPAIKGVTGAFVGMINPVTVLAATLLALGGIWYDSERRLSALNASIYKGNELVGASKYGLETIAEGATIAGNSIAEAQDAIKALAATGEVSSERLANFGKAAQAIAVTTGKDIATVAEEMATLGDTATEKAEKLSEKYGIVSAAQYEIIRALEKKGQTEEAMDVLSQNLADGAQERLKRYRESLSDIERDWMDIKTAISDAYAAVRAELFPDENDEIKQLQRILQTRKDGGVLGAVSNFMGFGENSSEEVAKRLRGLLAKREQREADQKAIADRNKANQEIINSEKDLYKKLENAGKGAKKNTYLEELNKQFDSLVENAKTLKTLPKLLEGVTWTKEGGYKGGAYDTLKADAERKFKEKQGRTPRSAILDNTDANELGNSVNEIKAKYKNLNEGIAQQQKIGTISSEAAVAKRKALLAEEAAQIQSAYQQQIASLEALKNSKNISANQIISLDRQIADARSKMAVAAEDAERKQKKVAEDEEVRLDRQRKNIAAYRKALVQMLEDQKVAAQRERAGLRQTSGERQVSGQLNAEDDRYTNEVRSLNQQRAEDPTRAGEIEKELALAAEYHSKMKDQIVSDYDDMKTAQKDWSAGAEAALKQYAEDGQNYATMAYDAVSSAISGMEDALVSFVTTGKLSFSSLATSILSDMARIAVRAASSEALGALFSFGMSMWPSSSASLGSTSAGYSSQYMDAWNASQHAKGSAWSGGTEFFAKGGAFTNSIVSKPTAFSSASGGKNIMGEAGPEAIMPLTRSSDGSLGVRAQVDLSGLSGAGSGGVFVTVNVNGDTGATETSSSNPSFEQFGKDLGAFVDQRYRALMNKDLSPGGDIWKSQNGRN